MNKRKTVSLLCTAALLLAALSGAVGGMLGIRAAELPAGATIGKNDPKLVMEPGTVDYVIGSDTGVASAVSGNAYYTDYAKAFAENQQDGGAHDSNTDPGKYIYALAPAVGARQSDYYFGSFMGEPVYSQYLNTSPWCHGGLIYRIRGGSYAAAALLISRSQVSTVSPEEYIFEASTDGTAWTKLTTTYSLEFDANDPVAAAGKNPTVSVYKAVVKLPGTNTDVVSLRITLPGGTEDNGYCWPGKNYAYNTAMLGTLVVSAHDLNGYKTLAEVPEFKTPVLSPGIYDDLSTEYYYEKFIRSTWNNVNDYNWNDTEGHKCYQSLSRTGWGDEWPQLLGRFMGVPIETVISTTTGWNGSSLIYEVAPKSYVATAIATTADDATAAEHLGCFGFEVSADKQSWTAVNAAVTKTAPQEGDKSYYTAYKAVVQIPDGMKYYRVTLPGFNKAAQNGNEMTWAARDSACESGFAVGGSFASVYDLTQYDDMTKVPDSPTYVNVREKLTAAIVRAKAVNLSLYKSDAAAEAFVQKLAEAEAYAAEEHTQAEFDAMADALDAARAALVERGEPDEAHVEQGQIRILKPGVTDALTAVSIYHDEAGEPFIGSDGVSNWYACYSDYGKVGLISTLENRYLTAYRSIHVISYDYPLFSTFQKLNFMGQPIGGAYINTTSWAGANVTYAVYAGSYVQTAILVNAKAATADWSDVQNNYVFQVSADEKNWTEITAEITERETVDDVTLYTATAQIPAGAYFLRIIMPGAKTNMPEDVWYAGSPSYNHTFLGPIVASMHDLKNVASLADVADACAWYADAAITSNDTQKLQITDGYFKVMESGMTAGQALALLDTQNGSVQFYNADGSAVTDMSTVLSVGMKADILDAHGLSMNACRGTAMLTVSTGNDLLSIGTIADITREYGVKKTAEDMGLPETVAIEAGSGSFDAAIRWDVDGCAFDPAITQTQEFTVSGTVVLPDGVENGGDLDLHVTVKVTVSGSTAYGLASADEKQVRVDNENQRLYIRKGMTLAELTDLLRPVGDVEIAYCDADGEELTDGSTVLAEGMTADLYTEVVMLGSYEISYMGAADSSAEDSDGSHGENPDTGVPALWLPTALLLLGGAAAVGAGKRRAR